VRVPFDFPLAAEPDVGDKVTGQEIIVEKAIVFYEERYKRVATYLIFVPLLLMTIIEFLNAIGRKLLIPFPGTVESVESLLVISVYFGVSLVALEAGHVNVTVMTRQLPAAAQHALDAVAQLLAALVFGYLTAGAWAEAVRSIGVFEFRMGVYRFPLWPFKTLYAFGMTLLTMQLLINLVKHIYLAAGRATFAGLKREISDEPIVMT
jgi:TRAP-type C4-dicarboxylate transport system permease small subunit